MYEFNFFGQPKIKNLFSVPCNNGTFDAVIDAVGIAPLTYRIIEKSGLPFVINNGNSNLFIGLLQAKYKFQIEDACGNILNSEFEAPKPFDFSVISSVFCDGLIGTLTVPNFISLNTNGGKVMLPQIF